MRYYYLVASLPSLAPGEPPPINLEGFGTACRQNLSPQDFQSLETFFQDFPMIGNPGLAAFGFFEIKLRNAVVLVRAQKHGTDAKGFLRDAPGYSVYIEEAVADAQAKANPLEREHELDRLRWQSIDEVVLKDPFGLMAVAAYGLKLRMVSRWQGLNVEAGRTRLDTYVQELARLPAGGV